MASIVSGDNYRSSHLDLDLIKRDRPGSSSISLIPLQNSWSFWFDRYLGPGLTVQEYEEGLKKLGTFSTVQDFWKWHNNLPDVSKLPPKTSYHLMKENIRPLWEDLNNVHGGSFCIKVPKAHTSYAWLNLLLGAIGEQFCSALKERDDICGISVSIRRDEDILIVWHKSAKLVDVSSFSSLLKEQLPKFKCETPTYKIHQNEDNFKVDFKQVSPVSKGIMSRTSLRS